MKSFARDHKTRAAAVARQAAIVASCLAGAARMAAAQSAMVQGIVVGEFWSTDAKSTLLTRNAGRPAFAGGLQLWGAVELTRGVIVYSQGELEGGRGSYDGETQTYLDQLGVRLLVSNALVLDAGRLPSGVGAFVNRRLSTRNPLIGAPDAYSARYPVGAQLSGVRGNIDYRVAVQSLPVTHHDYVPDPSSAAHPVLGFGVTPMIGLHIGMSGTYGPYLNCDLDTALLAGRSWRRYAQRLGALDVSFSRGYLETYGELAAGNFDVPGGTRLNGFTYYGEAKYTLSPRLFVAGRYERNDYPYLQPNTFGGGGWIARVTDFSNVEAGLGWRFSSALLFKASYRADRWLVEPALRQFVDNGRAFAMQLSYAFDASSWATKK